ncbi:FAD-dependent monooxygenase [Amycolatopsis sp. PS_44_ISF1]|uniref:FAD-dependent monooxygenase n=1 Tax=Amycolatopsis sp. PS_44_ISF1 TaxID=2974917 RepID=UPI0028DDE999|nr:FAD-dependent monooxygenase [Amycolatopsis sp. PS_44_ISF1]MDT8912313.1 FAD-dependent monooxygenase [Amycolatopsis sp. PS_44_ISF1]
MRILISGASIAGPVLAYWLCRYGFDVTVVERSPELRKAGGHAVDLYRPAVDITERMGVLPEVEAVAIDSKKLTLHREGAHRPARADLTKIFQASSDRDVEVMRDDLSKIYYDAGREHAEYLFDDSITGISPDGDVTFSRAAPRRFDVVVGADGLHSNVRRLVFGDEGGSTRFMGAYLAILSLPKDLGPGSGETVAHFGPGRTAACYTARNLADARAIFLFRRDHQPDLDHRDIPRQKQLVREAYAGMHPQVDRWLATLDDPNAFYFDSISQLDLEPWSRGRVTLVGDAGYCPGPAVGGGTSLAVLGAYVLAGELASAGGDHVRAFDAYEKEMKDVVRKSRAFAQSDLRTIIPATSFGVRAFVYGARLVSAMPAGVAKVMAKLNSGGAGTYESVRIRDYAGTPPS